MKGIVGFRNYDVRDVDLTAALTVRAHSHTLDRVGRDTGGGAVLLVRFGRRPLGHTGWGKFHTDPRGQLVLARLHDHLAASTILDLRKLTYSRLVLRRPVPHVDPPADPARGKGDGLVAAVTNLGPGAGQSPMTRSQRRYRCQEYIDGCFAVCV